MRVLRPDARRRLAWAALLLAPLVFRDDLSRFALARVGAFAVAATGVSIVSGLAGQISLGHAGLMAAGAFTSAGLAVHAGWPFAATWAAGTALAAAVGLAFGVPSLRVRRQYLALATLGGGFIIWQIIREAGSLTGSDFGLASVPPPSAFGHAFGPLGSALLVMGLLAAALYGAGNLERSRAGRAFRAVRDSETGAGACGISVFRAKLVAFVASAAIAGAAGGLFAHAEGFISPNQFDPRASFTLVLATVLGGFASPYGGALGAALILGPSELFPAAFSWLERYQLVAWGPLALLVVFRWPEGVAGGIARLARRARAGGWVGRRRDEVPAAPAAAGTEVSMRGVASGAPLLVARDVAKTFGGLRALDGVSIEVRAGTIHALIGPNGSGKTTLLDCFTGVLRADAGEVRLAGSRIDGRPAHEVAAAGVARTFQQVALFGAMTAEENVLCGAHPRTRGGVAAGALGIGEGSDEDARAAARAILDHVGLAGRENDLALSLSYGQRKRLELGRALSLRPSLLLLDEPAAGRNEQEILELGRMLKRLRSEGLTILLVEHHMNFVLSLADVVTVLDEGRAIAEGRPAEVRRDPAVITAYLGASVA
jgi:branched-chain amino acid transport system ATP-binding protein/branched-chain amino acid transport system permease protein